MVWVSPSTPIGIQMAPAIKCIGIETSRNLGAQSLKDTDCCADLLVDAVLRIRLGKSFRDHPNLHALDAAFGGFGVRMDLHVVLPRVIAIRTGEHFEEQCVVGNGGGDWTGVVHIDLNRHDPGIWNEPVGRFHAVGSAKRRRHPDGSTLVATNGHVSLA